MRTHLASLLVIALTSITAAAAAQDFDAEGEEAMLNRINALRVEHSLAPLARLPELDAVARAHSADMAGHGALAHVSPQSGTPDDRVRAAGVEASTVAENVALHRDASAAQEALLASPPHRANILSDAVTHVGLGVVRTAQGVYVTQVFAGIPSEPEPAAPIEAPAEDAGSIFQIIPPFVEQAGQVLGGAEPAPAAPSAPGAAPGRPAEATLRQIIGLARSLLAAEE